MEYRNSFHTEFTYFFFYQKINVNTMQEVMAKKNRIILQDKNKLSLTIN